MELDLMFLRKQITYAIDVKNGLKEELKKLEDTDIDKDSYKRMTEIIADMESVVFNLIIEITDLKKIENEKIGA